MGIGGFLWLVVSGAFLVRRALIRARATGAKGVDSAASEPRRLCTGFAAAWFCGLVYSLFAFPFHAPDRVLLYWTLFGLMGSSAAALSPHRPPREVDLGVRDLQTPTEAPSLFR